MTHNFDPTILREYDIRGIVGDTLTERDAEALGRVFGSSVRRANNNKPTKICLGYDGRLTSPSLANAVKKGLLQAGVHVIEIGRGPTPMLYFAVKHLEAEAGLMVTGSHNPANYNGFKMMLKNAPVFGSMIRDYGIAAAKADWDEAEGTSESHPIQSEYVARLLKDAKGLADLRVVWDVGNGAAGDALAELVAKLPGEHYVLFGDIDGTFPNHHPDPTVEKNLEDLKREVLLRGADLGIAFDGDGDRIGAIDGQARVVWGDQLLALYARAVLKDHPGATIIGDVKASQLLFDEIKRLGGEPLMWKTGHSLIKSKMAETDAKLAGEMSGHIFFADKYYGFDDALYCAVRLLSLISDQGKSLATMYDELPVTFSTPEMRIEVADDKKFAVIDAIADELSQTSLLQVNTVDGVRVTTKDGWWLLRASNTQPALVGRAEANSSEAVKSLENLLRQTLARHGVEWHEAAH